MSVTSTQRRQKGRSKTGPKSRDTRTTGGYSRSSASGTTVAADSADERVGSAVGAVGRGMGNAAREVTGAFSAVGRKAGASASRRRKRPMQEDTYDDAFGASSPKEHGGADAYDEHDGYDEGDLTERGRRADAIGLVLIGLAAVLGASVWLDIAGPVGAAIASGVHWIIGAGALVLPVVLVGIAIAVMLGLGSSASERAHSGAGLTIIAICMLGLIHVFAGTPESWADRKVAGGAVGALVGGPLSAGFTPYVAVPLLGLVIVYAALLATGITVRESFDYIRNLIRSIASNAYTPDPAESEESDDMYGYVEGDLDDIAEGRERRPRAQTRQPRPAKRPRTPMDNYPVDPADENAEDPTLFDAPADPAPRRRTRPRPAAEAASAANETRAMSRTDARDQQDEVYDFGSEFAAEDQFTEQIPAQAPARVRHRRG